MDHTFPVRTARRGSLTRTSIQQSVYVGIYFELPSNVQEPISYCVCAHDGSFAVDYHISTLEPSYALSESERFNEVSDRAIAAIKSYSESQHYKIHAVALNRKHPDDEPSDMIKRFASRIWFEIDAVPFLLYAKAGDVDERADSLVRKVVMRMSPQYPGSMPRIEVTHKHRVDVDLDDIIHICGLRDYQDATLPQYWGPLMDLSLRARKRRLRVSFFSSTPQGGGVALMRHALLRLARLLNVQFRWYVAKPKPEVFDITKRKFHNVLQGVAPPDARLTEEEQEIWRDWVIQNVESYWLGERGPLMNSDVIVVDDPQLCAMIPMIRAVNPKVKVIYRSHIEIRADLVRQEGSPQADVWRFLSQFIGESDLFISHPIDNFIPDSVPRDKVMLMPASTDPIDGLNKNLTWEEMHYYRSLFNRISWDQNGSRLEEGRSYIIQIARFDPSKGIPDVLHAYYRFRERISQDRPMAYRDPPQLILCGHGSVDDPDGTLVYEQVMELLISPEFQSLAQDVCVTRLPPCDQILNALIRGADIVLQLSHREGFEIKVTEAISKGIPVIAYAAGGIPHQVKDGVDGFLVKVKDIEGVVDRLVQLWENPDLMKKMGQAGANENSGEYFTPASMAGWLSVFLDLMDGRTKWDTTWVKNMWMNGALKKEDEESKAS
ncbi:MAG: hypothetical protein DHS80DRAFT_13549 [Piptocephalis tieghemiana]|nr:MAG: hypothetical protein DHS80DRAFT_13549 [Piptocephalis tieghemiana]